MNLKKWIGIGFLLAVAQTAVMAQGFRVMGGGGGMSQGMVLFSFSQDGPGIRADVSKELKLTDAQKSKISDFQQKQMEEMMGLFQGGERPSQEQMQGIMKKRNEAETKFLGETLDETQRKRLRELWIQRLDNAAMLNEELAKELAITDEQKQKAKDLQAKQAEANQSVREKARNGELDFTEIRAIMDKNTKALNVELGKLLTDDQKAKLKTMRGAEFKFDADF